MGVQKNVNGCGTLQLRRVQASCTLVHRSAGAGGSGSQRNPSVSARARSRKKKSVSGRATGKEKTAGQWGNQATTSPCEHMLELPFTSINTNGKPL
jgi:hypothetical protein